MKEIIININSIDKAKRFCQLAGESLCDKITLKSNIYVIDGKSLLGIFSLDLSKNITCIVSGSENDITSFIEKVKEIDALV